MCNKYIQSQLAMCYGGGQSMAGGEDVIHWEVARVPRMVIEQPCGYLG